MVTRASAHDSGPDGISPQLVNCRLAVPSTSSEPNQFAIIGNVAQLGAWDPELAIRLLPNSLTHTFTADLLLPLGENIEAKVWTRSIIHK